MILPAIVLLVLASVPLFYSADDLRAKVTELLSEALDVPIQIGPVEYSLLTGGSVSGIEIGSPDGFSKPLLRVSKVRIDYDFSNLLRRKLKLKEFVIEKPELTIEFRQGVSNLQEILSTITSKAPKDSDTKKLDEAQTQKLSPLEISFNNLAIEQASLTIVNKTASTSLEPISLRVDGVAAPELVRASVRVVMNEGHFKSNITRQEMTSHITARPKIDWVTDFSVGLDKKIRFRKASTKLSFALEKMQIHLEDLENQREVDIRDKAFALDMSASLPEQNDNFFVEKFTMSTNQSKMLDATLSLRGIHAFTKLPQVSALPDSVQDFYFTPRSKEPGQLDIRATQSLIHLSEFEPFIRALMPNARLRGTVTMDDFLVLVDANSAKELRPKKLLGKLAFEKLNMTMPERQIALSDLSGAILIGSDDEIVKESKVPFSLKSGLESLTARDIRISRATMDIQGSLEGTSLSTPGATQLTLKSSLAELVHPSATANSIRFTTDFSSPALFSPGTAKDREPSRLKSELIIPLVKSRTGTTTVEVRGIRSVLSSQIPAILPPSSEDIAWSLNSEIKTIRQARKFAANEIGLSMRGTLKDPRFQSSISPSISGRLKIRSAYERFASLKNFSVTSKLKIRDWMPLENEQSLFPETVTASVSGHLPQITYAHPQHGKLNTGANFSVLSKISPKIGKLRILSSKLKFEDIFSAKMSGQVSNLLSARRRVNVRYTSLFADLSKLPPKLPSKLKAQHKGLDAQGRVSLVGNITGRIPQPSELSIDQLPTTLAANLVLEDVSLNVPSQQIKVSGCNGEMRTEISKNKASIDISANANQMTHSVQGERYSVDDIRAVSRIGIEDSLFFVDGTINAAGVLGSGKRIGRSGPLEMTANVRYPRFENLELDNISMDLPEQESSFRMSGRLKREKFGVFRPELNIESRLLFDKLKDFVPELSPFSGQFLGRVGLKRSSETNLVLQGHAGFERFGYETEDLTIEGLQGGVPFRQMVRVPKITSSNAEGERGVFGDDFETQLAYLIKVLSTEAKFAVSDSNILIEPPRTADYESMRNFYTADRAAIRIDRIKQANNEVKNLSLDASYSSGVFQLDRLALQIWEGDVFGDLALQLSGEDDMRLRMRMTATDLNLDLLTAEKVGEPLSRGLARKDFLFSGVSDIKLDIGQKVINGTFDVSKLSIPLVIRLVDFQDPDGQDESLQGIKLPLKIGQGLYTFLMGERLSGMKVWIKQNLLNQSFVWDRPWIGEIRPHEIGLDTAFDWLGLDILTEKGIPNPIPIASRTLQFLFREVSQGTVNLTLADTVQEIRRKNLAEVWANPFWEDLDSKIKPFAGRVVIE